MKTFRSIGASQLETVEHVAARLFFVIKAANSGKFQKQIVHNFIDFFFHFQPMKSTGR
jgi:hypothetical protein